MKKRRAFISIILVALVLVVGVFVAPQKVKPKLMATYDLEPTFVIPTKTVAIATFSFKVMRIIALTEMGSRSWNAWRLDLIFRSWMLTDTIMLLQ